MKNRAVSEATPADIFLESDAFLTTKTARCRSKHGVETGLIILLRAAARKN